MDYQSLEKLLHSIQQAISPTTNNVVAGGVDSAAASNPLYLMMMQAAQGDVMNKRPASPLPASPLPASPLPASPSGTVTSSPIGPLSASAPGAPSVPLSTSNFTPPPTQSPAPNAALTQSGEGSIPWWANAAGADFSNNTPMPRPRPHQAQSMPPSNGTVPGAVGPTSLGGMPLMNPNGSIPGSVGPTSVGGAPLSAPQTQNGSGLIQQMLAYLHQQAHNQDPGNNADASTYGGSSPYNGNNS